MPINVKDVGASATKFVQRAQAAAPDYQKGVQGAGAHWQTQAAASNDTYVAGVTAAANAGRYKSGVANKGSKYEANAAERREHGHDVPAKERLRAGQRRSEANEGHDGQRMGEGAHGCDSEADESASNPWQEQAGRRARQDEG